MPPRKPSAALPQDRCEAFTVHPAPDARRVRDNRVVHIQSDRVPLPMKYNLRVKILSFLLLVSYAAIGWGLYQLTKYIFQ